MPVNDASPSAPSMMSIGLPHAAGLLELRLDARHERVRERRHLEAVGREQVGRDRAVAAAVGDHGDAAPARPRRAHERLAGVDQLARRVDAHDARLAAGRRDHGVARDERARVRGGAARAGGRATAVEQDHGLLRRCGARRLDEGAAVGDVLGVDRDRARGLVAGQVLDEVGQAHVGLVADRGEAREPEAAALEQHAELDREVARLRDQADGAGGVVVRGDVELRERVVDADAVGAEHDRARARARARPAPARARGPASPFSASPAVITISARAPCASDSSTACSSPASGTDTTTVSIAPPASARLGEQRMAVDLAAAAVDQVHRAAVRAAQGVAREPVAPLARIGRRAQHGDRARSEQRLEVARCRHSSPRAIAREMIRRWMSELPSQISWSFASRNHFSTGYSRE